MSPEVRAFVEIYAAKPTIQLSIVDVMKNPKKISLKALIKEHNHEIWRKCECGNEEDMRVRWDCSKCGKQIFKTGAI